MSADLLRAIEHAAVRGWPALESADIDGWIWRSTSGGSIRANSAATVTWHGTDIAQTIETCEVLYRAREAPCVFTISDVSMPSDLDARLAARGYARGDDHVTMAKALPMAVSRPVLSGPLLPANAHTSTTPTDAWFATYLSGLSEDRRGVARRLIANLPAQALFVSVTPVALERDPQPLTSSTGQTTSTGVTILDGRLASVQCMATQPEYRRQAGAWHVLSAIEALAQQGGASHLYLQTGSDNLAAQALYTKFGFHILGRYHTRTK